MLRKLLDLYKHVVYQNMEHPKETTSKELEKLSRMETAGGGDYIEPSLKAIEVSIRLS